MESTAGPGKRHQAASTSGYVAPHFPVDIVRKILLHLPAMSIRHYRTVCKDWRKVIADPNFAIDHQSLQPTLPLVSFLRGGGGAGSKDETGPVVDCCVEAFDLGDGSFRPVARLTDKEEQCSSFHIHGSLDGLLLISFEGRFYVCNPATHQWLRFPPPLRDSFFAGFYRHDPKKEYRALFYRGEWPGTDYYIMAAESRRGMMGVGLPSETEGFKFRAPPYGPPVLVRGHLHWMPQQRPEGYGILAFNTTTEVPKVMSPPQARDHMSLAAVGDDLAMFSCGNDAAVVELWLLRDYENQIWACMHRIQLPAVQVSTFPLDGSWRMFYMSEEGVVIATPEQKLLHYDLNGTLLRETFPCHNGRHLKITPYTYKESLVCLEFFKTKDDGNTDDDEDKPEPLPPFFKGL